MSKKATSVALICILMLLTSCYTLQVNKVDPSNLQKKSFCKENGFIYALPKKELGLEVILEQTIYEPPKLIGIDTHFYAAIKPIQWQLDLIESKKESYKIKSLKLLEQIVPDSLNLYFVSLLGNRIPFFKAEHSFFFSSGIFLTESKSITEDQTVDFIAESIPGIVKSLIPGGSIGSTLSEAIGIVQIRSQNSAHNHNKQVKSTTEIVVERILTLQEDRKKLICGFASKEIYKNEQLNALLKLLDQEILSLMTLIEGTKTTVTIKTILPIEPKVGTTIVSYFSEKAGISLNDTTGNMFPITVMIPRNEVNVIIANHYSCKEYAINRKGIYYRIPFMTELIVNVGVKELFRTNVSIPQLGNVAFLPSKIAIRSNDIEAALDEKTGALIKFEANGEGINLETAEKLIGSSEVIQDNKIKQLENKIRLLELQSKLDSLNKK